jgi:uncharacterized DUF497 family protein
VVEFDWDDGNRDKNLRHGVHDWEIEEALAHSRTILVEEATVRGEVRYIVLGRARTSGKHLRVVYTLRVTEGRMRYRPISAVEMSARERRRYRRGT